MKGFFAVLFAVLFIAGCSAFKFRAAGQNEVADLAISIGSKALGLRLAAKGFVWTPEIEEFYQLIITKDKLSLTAAELAETYVRANVDPIIADDILRLAAMVGVEFDSNGHPIGTGGVRMGAIRIASQGFRLAVIGAQ